MTHPEDLEWPEALLNARVRFWMCINRDHKSVTWDGDVATCPDCGLTSEMTSTYAKRVRAQVVKEVAADRDVLARLIEQQGIDVAAIRAQVAEEIEDEWDGTDGHPYQRAAEIARGGLS